MYIDHTWTETTLQIPELLVIKLGTVRMHLLNAYLQALLWCTIWNDANVHKNLLSVTFWSFKCVLPVANLLCESQKQCLHQRNSSKWTNCIACSFIGMSCKTTHVRYWMSRLEKHNRVISKVHGIEHIDISRDGVNFTWANNLSPWRWTIEPRLVRMWSLFQLVLSFKKHHLFSVVRFSVSFL